MNIVVVTPSWPQDGNPNGIVTYYTHLVPAMIELGHEVHVITFRSSDVSENVHVIDYPLSVFEKLVCKLVSFFDAGYRQYFINAKSIAYTLEKINAKSPIDIVQMEDSFGWHYIVSALSKKIGSFPVVMRLHGPYFLNSFEATIAKETKKRLEREAKAFLAAKFVTSPSKDVLEATQNKYGQSWLEADVIGNAMPIQNTDKQWQLSSIMAQQILFVGRFDNHKGGDVMLHAFFKVKALMPHASLIFIGPDKGLEENGYKLNVEQFLDKYQYDADCGIQFLGKQDKNTINAYRQSSHVTVVASRYETFGNVALEAFASASPLVCSDAGALTEIVQDDVSGLIFKSEDDVALAEKIMQIFHSDSLASRLSAGGLARVNAQFSPLAAAQKTVGTFSKVVAHSEQ